MIKSFRGKTAQKVFSRERAPQFPEDAYKAAQRKLAMIDAAVKLADLKVPPGNRLERLKGGRKDEFSMRINDQWRVCFRWENGDAHDVEITDYH